MSMYEVVGMCNYVKDGRVVRLRQVGAHVDLDDDTAAKLGDAVKQVGESPEPAASSAGDSAPAEETTPPTQSEGWQQAQQAPPEG